MDIYIIFLILLYVVGAVILYKYIYKTLPEKLKRGRNRVLITLLICSNIILSVLYALWYEYKRNSGIWHRLRITNLNLIIGIAAILFSSIELVKKLPKDEYIDQNCLSSYYGILINNSSQSNNWGFKFAYLSGTICKTFIAKTEYLNLIIDKELSFGTIDFELYNSADSLIMALPVSNNFEFIPNNDYIIKAKVKNASGEFSVRIEE